MLRLLSDENFDNNLVRNLRQKMPELDLVRVQDEGLIQTDDPIILEWAANQHRIVLTHDLKTMPDYAYERIKNNLPMPGVFAIPDKASSTEVMDSLLMILQASDIDDWRDKVTYLPL